MRETLFCAAFAELELNAAPFDLTFDQPGLAVIEANSLMLVLGTAGVVIAVAIRRRQCCGRIPTTPSRRLRVFSNEVVT